jgi:hypothetical protein
MENQEMRKNTMFRTTFLLLFAWLTAVSAANDRRAAIPDAPQPTPAGTRPAPLPDEVMDDNHSQPAEPVAAPRADSPRPAADNDCPDAARRPHCGHHCGCRCQGECGQAPFGASVNAAANAQICNGIGARMTLYHYDFCDARAADGYKLNERGVARLGDIARMFPCSNFHPIVIEYTSRNSALDAARRDYVLRALRQMSVPVPEHLVVVGRPEVKGLRGDEAVILDKNLKEQTKNGPTASPTNNGDASSSGPGMGTNNGSSSGRNGQ